MRRLPGRCACGISYTPELPATAATSNVAKSLPSSRKAIPGQFVSGLLSIRTAANDVIGFGQEFAVDEDLAFGFQATAGHPFTTTLAGN